MPVPAIPAVAKALSSAAGAAQASKSREPGPERSWLVLLLIPVVLVTGLVVILSMAGTTTRDGCVPVTPGTAPSGPGALGGVGGTGISAELVDRVRRGSPYAGSHVTTGRYTATAYGPPWGGIQGAGIATSGGLPIAGGAPRWYMIATSPGAIAHGTFVYIWPNPFGWRGPFFAADTGGAIVGNRIDFYDWRGRASQTAWGLREVRVRDAPRTGSLSRQPVSAPRDCNAPTSLSSEVGLRIGEIARSHLGSGSTISGFTPPSVSYFWCAWFATNVWRKAGLDIPMSAFSGYPYTWAQPRALLFKELGKVPRGPTPPVGSALMYGTSPASTSTSWHVNLVDKVLPDGSMMITGGNQDGGRVTRYGPCRLNRSDPAYLTPRENGCDPRSIYGIAMPSQSRESSL